MGLLDSISNGLKGHFDKNKERREMMEGLQKEADLQRLSVFRDEFSKNAKEVAIAEAKKEAAELSGLRKLRATNRVRNLSSQGPEPGTGSRARYRVPRSAGGNCARRRRGCSQRSSV